MSMNDPGVEEKVGSHTKDEVDEPPLYRVLLHNDDYSTMEFVIEVLMHVFHKNEPEATRIMLNVHKNGIGDCGVFTFDVAETKVNTVHALAQDRGFPLKCSMEEA